MFDSVQSSSSENDDTFLLISHILMQVIYLFEEFKANLNFVSFR